MPVTAAHRQKIEAITGRIGQMTLLSGGDINELSWLRCEKGEFVVKSHNDPPAGFFSSEALGLNMLRGAGVKVPEIFLVDANFLLMEYLTPGEPRQRDAGAMLAQLHRVSQQQYGFRQNIYLATLLQNNSPNSDWADFYLQQRIFPLLATQSTGEMNLWYQFSGIVRPFLDSCPAPALLHGDLWAGNLYHSSAGPVFIDPACYYGDALVDIAMTRLFGNFGPAFYAAYAEQMPVRPHSEELISVYQIYPLLVHFELFGSGYYKSACRIRDAFLCGER